MRKTIALVAHDNEKKELLEWAKDNWKILIQHRLVCTGTTGGLIHDLLSEFLPDEESSVSLLRLKSGPLGGDQQMGAMIAEGKIDIFIFFWDPMTAQPHDVDVKALLRISTLYNIPTATNCASADFLISSPLLNENYSPTRRDFSSYTGRKLEV